MAMSAGEARAGQVGPHKSAADVNSTGGLSLVSGLRWAKLGLIACMPLPEDAPREPYKILARRR